MDLIQAGNIGLLSAADRWDHTFGTKFSTYAVFWIRQSIARTIADQSLLIRLPVHLFDQVAPLLIKSTEWIGNASDAATVLIDQGIKPSVAVKVTTALSVISLDMMLSRRSSSLDAIAVTQDFSDGSNAAEELSHHMALLKSKQRDVMELRWGLRDGQTRTLEEVGQLFGVTRERIRQIESKAFRILRKSFGLPTDPAAYKRKPEETETDLDEATSE